MRNWPCRVHLVHDSRPNTKGIPYVTQPSTSSSTSSGEVVQVDGRRSSSVSVQTQSSDSEVVVLDRDDVEEEEEVQMVKMFNPGASALGGLLIRTSAAREREERVLMQPGTIMKRLQEKHPDTTNFARNFSVPMERGPSSSPGLVSKINRRSPKPGMFFKKKLPPLARTIGHRSRARPTWTDCYPQDQKEEYRRMLQE